jgi:hypothetical protein
MNRLKVVLALAIPTLRGAERSVSRRASHAEVFRRDPPRSEGELKCSGVAWGAERGGAVGWEPPASAGRAELQFSEKHLILKWALAPGFPDSALKRMIKTRNCSEALKRSFLRINAEAPADQLAERQGKLAIAFTFMLPSLLSYGRSRPSRTGRMSFERGNSNRECAIRNRRKYLKTKERSQV